MDSGVYDHIQVSSFRRSDFLGGQALMSGKLGGQLIKTQSQKENFKILLLGKSKYKKHRFSTSYTKERLKFMAE